MIEIWWKVFILAVITIIVVKLFGSSASIMKIFSLAFLGWAVGLILLIVISGFIWEKWKNRNKKKEEEN